VNTLRASLALILLASWIPSARAYSVLTHEAVIDASWDRSIQPLLLQRFPGSTPEDLRKAHAFAYGGCIIQDLGYYPFGTKLFSDLVHYVRSGDFVEALIHEAQDVNEYAFALGALAHYAGDNNGHPIAVNLAVPMMYPKLKAKYGAHVTYAQDPAAHLKTEFGFDVVQVANHKYAPEAYHDFIGFQVAKPLLDRAFFDTYDLHLKDVFSNLDLALGTYRHSVGSIIPTMTKAAWVAKKDEIIGITPGATQRKFVYILSRASYEKEWGADYERPSLWARFLAFLFKLLPKSGMFRALAFMPPSHETELLFMKSFDATFDRYRALLDDVKADRLRLTNENLDIGKPTRAGAYSMADNAFASLLDKLSERQFAGLTPELRTNILDYYADLSRPIATKKRRDAWQKTLKELDGLKLAEPGVEHPATVP
jgi:hypothetical protein